MSGQNNLSSNPARFLISDRTEVHPRAGSWGETRHFLRRLALALALALPFAAAFAAPPPPVPALPDAERRISYSITGSTCACSLGSQLPLYGDGTDVDAWLEVWINGTRYLST